jgi:hypothetical protein
MFFFKWTRRRCRAELAAAIVSILGLIVAVLMLPETKGKSLEELNMAPQTARAASLT